MVAEVSYMVAEVSRSGNMVAEVSYMAAEVSYMVAIASVSCRDSVFSFTTTKVFTCPNWRIAHTPNPLDHIATTCHACIGSLHGKRQRANQHRRIN